jgi:flavin-dependent dehydrogenase
MTIAGGHVFDTDVTIIGAGVAGCAAALTLSRQGFRVALLERSTGPQTRFCGEFVSGEALSLLARLGVAEGLVGLGATPVRRLELHATRGWSVRMPLVEGSFGLSRRALDAVLLQRALREGARLFSGMQVTAVSGSPAEGYRVEAFAQADRARVFSARVVIGAHGKRSSVDRLLSRRFLTVNSGWIASTIAGPIAATRLRCTCFRAATAGRYPSKTA